MGNYQGKTGIFRPIDKDEREMFNEVTKDLTGVGYDPLAVKLWPINGGTDSAEYAFLCAAYPVNLSGQFTLNLAMVYITEMTLGKHEFKLGKIKTLAEIEEDPKTIANASVIGGWNVNPILCPPGTMPEKLASGFAEAFTGWTGTRYEPRIYCGTQAVNGTNHMLICVGNLLDEKSTPVIAQVVLHETCEPGKAMGHYSVLNIDQMILGEGEGGWHLNPVLFTEDCSLPRRLPQGMQQAFGKWDGASFKPLMFCGTQVVNGTNYMLICEASPIVPNPPKHIVKLILHEEPPESGSVPGEFSIHYIEEII